MFEILFNFLSSNPFHPTITISKSFKSPIRLFFPHVHNVEPYSATAPECNLADSVINRRSQITNKKITLTKHSRLNMGSMERGGGLASYWEYMSIVDDTNFSTYSSRTMVKKTNGRTLSNKQRRTLVGRWEF